MSNPKNPLSDYRSYSYYHTLIACDSTATVRALISQLDQSDILRPKADNNFAPRSRQPVALPDNKGNFVVLIDGARDVDVVITEMEYTSWILPEVNSGDTPGIFNPVHLSYPCNGTLKIFELRGFNFPGMLIDAATAMNVRTPYTIPYLLKTYIVGYTHEGKTVPINDLAPLTIVFPTIQASTDLSGTTYTLTLFNCGGGLGELGPYHSVSPAVRMTNLQNYRVVNQNDKTRTPMSPDPKMSTAFQAIESNLNLQATVDYETAYKAAIKTADQRTVNSIIRRKYTITLEPPYDSDKFLLVAGAPFATNTGDSKNESPQVVLSNNVSVYDLFMAVFKACPALSEKGVVTIPRVYTTVELSTAVTDGVTQAVELVRYNIVPYQLYIPNKNSEIISGGPTGISNSYVFDYMYTGTNIDIVDFDLKMDILVTAMIMTGQQSNYKAQPLGTAETAKFAELHRQGDKEVVETVRKATKNNPNDPLSKRAYEGANAYRDIITKWCTTDSGTRRLNVHTGGDGGGIPSIKLEPELMIRQIAKESAGKAKAVGPIIPSGQHKGTSAIGIAQFVGPTAREYRLTDPTDPEQSIRAQCDYMKVLVDQFKGDYSKAFASYNGGAGNVRTAMRNARLVNNGNDSDWLNHFSRGVDSRQINNYVNTIMWVPNSDELVNIVDDTAADNISSPQQGVSLPNRVNVAANFVKASLAGNPIPALTPAALVSQTTVVQSAAQPPKAQGTALSPAAVSNNAGGTIQSNASYDDLVSHYVGAANVSAKITILGNPGLLSNTLPPLASDEKPTLTDSTESNKWLYEPVLIKVNVNTPSAVNPIGGGITDTKPFFYQGWYTLQSINHMFVGGQFTQTLKMTVKLDPTS